MNTLPHIFLISASLIGIFNMTLSHDVSYLNNSTIMLPNKLKSSPQAPKHFLPKSECNFNNSSNIASKKVKYFAYDCTRPHNNWLLINLSEANYYDVLHK